MKQIYERQAEGLGVRGIARALGLSRNSVRKYLRLDDVPKPKPRPKRGSKLDPFAGHLQQRLGEGVENWVVLLWELRAQGDAGSYALLKEYVHPHLHRPVEVPRLRFETAPGEQAQADFGAFRYALPDGAP